MQYDRDRSGTVEPHELQAALTSWGTTLVLILVIHLLFLSFFLFC